MKWEPKEGRMAWVLNESLGVIRGFYEKAHDDPKFWFPTKKQATEALKRVKKALKEYRSEL